MATKEYFGSAAANIVTRASLDSSTDWARYSAGAGDDKITWTDGEVLGQAGNDTITRPAGATGQVYATYWDSPAGIKVDLQAGTAEDGWGSLDTLVNITAVNDSGANDTIYGSAGNDYAGVDWGKNYVDLRGGIDTVNMEGPSTAWTITSSVDGRTVLVSRTDNPNGRQSELHNVEFLNFWNPTGGASETLRVTDLVDSAQKGLQTLVFDQSARWNSAGALGSAVTLTYSFANTAPTYGMVNGSAAQAWTAGQMNAVRNTLAGIAVVTNITFSEVADGAQSFGTLRFGINTQAGGKAGTGVAPNSANQLLAGDVWLDVATAAKLDGSGPLVLQREIGRALGLQTPYNESYTGTQAVLINSENDTRYTVMSETDVSGGLARDGLGMYDIAALRALYGSRAANVAGTTWSFSDSAGRNMSLIVDDGGSNTIDASTVSAGAKIDLRPGKLSSIGRDAQDLAATDNVAIAFGSTVNTVLGSGLDDRIIGNDNANLIRGNGGNDLIDGGAGTDTAQYQGKLAAYSVYISPYSGSLIVSARDGFEGTDTLNGVELLQFADVTLNLAAIPLGAASPNLDGSALADLVLGNDADNLLKGLAGNDVLDGGAGNDIAGYSGKRADYTVSANAAGQVLVNAKAGSEGSDTLMNIEHLAFSDMTVNTQVAIQSHLISTADLNRLQELYVGFFNRIPDADGMQYWINEIANGSSMVAVGDAFYGVAVQYSALTGYTAAMSNTDFIKVVYKNVLGRSTVDDGGMTYWLGQLSGGAATRGAMVDRMLSAAHTYKGDAAFGFVADLLDNKLAVATTFAIGLGLSYTSSEASIVNGMAISAAVTPTDMTAALKLIGVTDAPLVL